MYFETRISTIARHRKVLSDMKTKQNQVEEKQYGSFNSFSKFQLEERKRVKKDEAWQSTNCNGWTLSDSNTETVSKKKSGSETSQGN